MKNQSVDVVVIGAGPAGCIAASIIHQAGFSVTVLEREKFPRFVIGESLLPHSMEGFEAAGFIEAIKSKGFQQKFGAKFIRGTETCDFDFKDQFSPGWSWTWQVKRAEFDETLTHALTSMGVEILFQTTVTAVDFRDENVRISFTDTAAQTDSIEAKFVVDASGYGRVLPRLLKMEKASSLDPKKSVFAHLQDAHRDIFNEPDRIIALCLQPGVWAWIIPFSDGSSSVGIVGENIVGDEGPGQAFARFIRDNPYLKERFGDQPFLFEPRKLEAWSVASERIVGDRFVMVGNATEFLDPIFSSGVMFASVSAHLAATLLIRELKGEKVNWQSAYADYLQAGIAVFRSYVNAWYDGTLEKIFFARNPNMQIQQQICSVLAGYVWDESNPYAKDHGFILKRLAKMIELRDKQELL